MHMCLPPVLIFQHVVKEGSIKLDIKGEICFPSANSLPDWLSGDNDIEINTFINNR